MLIGVNNQKCRLTLFDIDLFCFDAPLDDIAAGQQTLSSHRMLSPGSASYAPACSYLSAPKKGTDDEWPRSTELLARSFRIDLMNACVSDR